MIKIISRSPFVAGLVLGRCSDCVTVSKNSIENSIFEDYQFDLKPHYTLEHVLLMAGNQVSASYDPDLDSIVLRSTS